MELDQEVTFESGPIEAYVPVYGSPVEIGSTCIASRIERNGQTFFKKRLRAEFKNDPILRNSFLKEYTLGLGLDCIYLPHYHELQEEDGTLCILMDNIEGQTLDALLKATPDYFNKTDNLQKFLLQLTEGLGYLHSHQIVHHDLQPRNIMLTTINHDVRIIDLGYCYSDSYQSSLGKTQTFSAPEKQCDARSDIYSVGQLILYISEHSTHPLPHRVLDVAERCTKENPDDRYPNIPALQKALKEKHWYKNPIPYLLLLACCLGLTGWWYKHHNRAYDFSARALAVEKIYYKIINEDSQWVEVVFPEKLGINDYAYDYTGGTDNIAVPDSVEYNGKYYTVVRLDDSCFIRCENLQVLTLPKTLREIGDAAVSRCGKLSMCQIPKSVRSIDKSAFWADGQMKEMILPPDLEYMGAGCLVGISAKKIVVPHKIKKLSQDCLCMQYHLQEVILPDSLEVIERGVFWKDKELEQITIPNHVREIHELAFYECTKLKDMYLKPLVPPEAYHVFDHPEKITIHVPAKALSAYQEDPYWSQCHIVTDRVSPQAPY